MPSVALALNDWNVPCLNGQCSYDVSNGTVSGSMSIVSYPVHVSDRELRIVCIERVVQRDLRHNLSCGLDDTRV